MPLCLIKQLQGFTSLVLLLNVFVCKCN